MAQDAIRLSILLLFIFFKIVTRCNFFIDVVIVYIFYANSFVNMLHPEPLS